MIIVIFHVIIVTKVLMNEYFNNVMYNIIFEVAQAQLKIAFI